MESFFRRVVLAVAVQVALFSGCAFGRAGVADAPIAWVRATESPDGDVLSLDVASRRYEREGGGAAVTLVGAVHIADRAFYESLQAILDEMDVVLYEGVRPPGAGRLDHQIGELNDELRAKISKRRVRFVASAVAMHRHREGSYPATLTDLLEAAPDRMRAFIKGSLRDAWDREVVYRVNAERNSYDVISLGADGAEGGEGASADLPFSTQKPLTEAETGGGGGGGRGKRGGKPSNIQADLAHALGVEFQLDAMSHEGKAWRNSDLSMDQVQERLEASGADASALFEMLDGSSFSARLASVVLRMVAASPVMQTMMKAIMVDMLGQAESLMEGMPGGMGKAMGVIIHDRNQVVIDDLRGVLENEPALTEIGVIYGAGHMADLDTRMRELGFAPSPGGEVWRAAITVRLDAPGVDAKQIRSMRTSMKRMIEQQMKQGPGRR